LTIGQNKFLGWYTRPLSCASTALLVIGYN